MRGDIAGIVNTSSSANRAQLVGDEVGNMLVTTYDWNTFLSPNFTKVNGVNDMQLFVSLLISQAWCWQQWDGPTTETVS